jgi:hypothetical protein
MKKIARIVLAWLCMVGLSWGGVLGDVNGDGAVGLPEAVHALQVSSGIRPQAFVQDTYDFTEYFSALNSRASYRLTQFGNALPNPSVVDVQVSNETIDGKNYTVWGESTISAGITQTSKTYFLTGPAGVAKAGLSGSMGTTITWMNPAVTIGSKSMAKGDIFSNFYSKTENSMTTGLYYEEYVFAGIEDVSVPAGVFANCLKMLNRRASGVYLRYYAKDAGLVKRVFSANNATMPSGYTFELISSLAAHCTGDGAWSDPDNPTGARNGLFAFTSYNPQGGKNTGILELKQFNDFHVPPSSQTFSLISSDGVNFTPDPDIYGINPPTLNVVVSGGSLSGSYTPATVIHHMSVGEPEPQSVRVITLSGTSSCTP